MFVYNGTDGALIKIIDNPESEANVNFGQGLAVTPSGQIAVGAFGANGGFGKLYLFSSISEGESLTPVNELPFSNSVLQAYVLDEAASNGWATVSEVTALNCANGDITDLEGLEALTDLQTLDLSSNTDILCSELDALETALPDTTITRPATCNNGGNTQSQQVQNLHNAQGQRVVKTVNGDPATAVHFIYDQSGQVIAEINAATGQTLREYIYINGQQIALVDDTGTPDEETYFVHNDHLGTPQKITNQAQVIVWDAVYKPFGEVELTTAEIENNIRFPWQYADEETGLHYNYFRDYDPTLGRYIESDPIGQRGGLNSYTYVSGKPIALIDPYALAGFTWYGNWGGPGRVNGKQYKNPSHPNRKRQGQRESDRFPRNGEPGFVPPVDQRDEAYYQHDFCISQCTEKWKDCTDGDELARCLSLCDLQLSKNPHIPDGEKYFFRLYSKMR